MARQRRFRIGSLQGLAAGSSVPLPEEEAQHARVLRLAAGTQVVLFDGSGRTALAKLTPSPAGWRAELIELQARVPPLSRLVLATAWPKGKRAAWLVEKCSELGVARILPVRYAHSVVHKAEESESLARLKRIAAAAAKQCGRSDVPEIAAEQTFEQVLAEETPRAFALLLHPQAEARLADVLQEQRTALREKPVLLVVGPEGGFAPEEIAAAVLRGVPRVRLARHVLRVETAAVAACAIAGAVLDE